jgi:ATP-dependent helicase/DNAse subunit B
VLAQTTQLQLGAVVQSIHQEDVEVLVETQYLALSHLTEVVVAVEIPKELVAQTGTHLVAVVREILAELAVLAELMETQEATDLTAVHILVVAAEGLEVWDQIAQLVLAVLEAMGCLRQFLAHL